MRDTTFPCPFTEVRYMRRSLSFLLPLVLLGACSRDRVRPLDLNSYYLNHAQSVRPKSGPYDIVITTTTRRLVHVRPTKSAKKPLVQNANVATKKKCNCGK